MPPFHFDKTKLALFKLFVSKRLTSQVAKKLGENDSKTRQSVLKTIKRYFKTEHCESVYTCLFYLFEQFVKDSSITDRDVLETSQMLSNVLAKIPNLNTRSVKMSRFSVALKQRLPQEGRYIFTAGKDREETKAIRAARNADYREKVIARQSVRPELLLSDVVEFVRYAKEKATSALDTPSKKLARNAKKNWALIYVCVAVGSRPVEVVLPDLQTFKQVGSQNKMQLQGFGKANKGKRRDFDLKHTATRPLAPGADAETVIRAWNFVRNEFKAFCKDNGRGEVSYTKQNFSKAIAAFTRGASRILEGKTKSGSETLPILRAANAKIDKSYTLYRLRHTYYTAAFSHYKSHPGMSVSAFLVPTLTGWTGQNTASLVLSYSDMIVKKDGGSRKKKRKFDEVGDTPPVINNTSHASGSDIALLKQILGQMQHLQAQVDALSSGKHKNESRSTPSGSTHIGIDIHPAKRRRARSRPHVNAGILSHARVNELKTVEINGKPYELSSIWQHRDNFDGRIRASISVLKRLRPDKGPSVNLIKALVGGNGKRVGILIKDILKELNE